MKKTLLTLSVAAVTLTACQTTDSDRYQAFFMRKSLPQPTVEQFANCYNYGCQKVDLVTLTDADWKDISKAMGSPKDAEAERAKLPAVIALFEKKVGALNGTDADKGGTFTGAGASGQQDCIDESTNTTTYLALLSQKGLLNHHYVSGPAARTPLSTLGSGHLWPHQTAVVVDKDTKQRYAVDSWFYDNGVPAEIVVLEDWYAGWAPASMDEDKAEKKPRKAYINQ